MRKMVGFTIDGAPVTKKNHSQMITQGGYPRLVPSKQYRQYEKDAIRQIPAHAKTAIDYPVNVKCVYYMPTKRRVDLLNLLAATCDILVKAGVLLDDNSSIAAAHDGSRVYYDKIYPRAEIEIRPMGD